MSDDPNLLRYHNRRLAVAMGFDQRTGGGSKLAQVDMLVLELILDLADLGHYKPNRTTFPKDIQGVYKRVWNERS
jgi:hypothetical protein